ncbi:MAG: phosphoribosyltransferase family protein [Acidobacteriaceae bacterium]
MNKLVINRITAMQTDPLELLQELKGYYSCPKDPATGQRLGPLVGYAGKDKQGRHYVGDTYANFAKAEPYPFVLEVWAEMLKDRIRDLGVDVFLGMPMGSIYWSMALARTYCTQCSFAEKKVTKAGSATEREEATLVLGRHEILPGQKVVICEDVVNNFSTTAEAIHLIKESQGVPLAIVALLNRSVPQQKALLDLPVYALVEKEIQQYEQDDPFVARDVAKNNVVWKVKPEWHRLDAAMKAHANK